MSLITRQALLAATLLIALANAQTCYYPDGKTSSTDIPCDPNAPASSCCGSDSFCLADGLCYEGGLVTRGSCTDKTWSSGACSSFCLEDDTNSAVGISPCTSGGSSNSFVCGVNTNQCQDDANTFSISSDTGIILRPAQIAALVESTLATAAPSGAIPQVTVTATPNSAGLYTAGTLAGVAVGIALPLLIILGVFFILLRREKRRFSKPKLMYKLPDELNDDLSVHSTVHSLQPPRSIVQSPAFSSYRSSHASGMTSPVDNRGSVRTTGTLASSRPAASPRIRSAQSQTFLERYETMKRNALAQSVDTSESRHELDTPPATTPTKEMPRYELSDTRMSH